MQKKRKLNVLINNAAVMLNPRDLTPRHTADGLEITMATNHLGSLKNFSVFFLEDYFSHAITGQSRPSVL